MSKFVSIPVGAKIKPLPAPAYYFPIENNRYDVKPNLFRLGKAFGNGDLDHKVLQFDNSAAAYRQLKLRSRTQNIDQYYCEELLNDKSSKRFLTRYLAELLNKEYSQYFELINTNDGWKILCKLTRETLAFNTNNDLLLGRSIFNSTDLPYLDGVDALACQFQEDLCVLSVDTDDDTLTLAHLCFPNRWSAKEKVGGSFASIHKPVAGFSVSNPKSGKLVSAILNGGPYVRFAWGLSNDKELNHHPSIVQPLQFNLSDHLLFMRVERQVLIGLPQQGLILFFIRTYYHDCHELRSLENSRKQLKSALNSMDSSTLTYKDLAQVRDNIVKWLEAPYR